MLGIIPAAGLGSRIQPLAFSKELLPVGSWQDGELERPKAVSEYLVERMVSAGADRICFVIAAEKSDIIGYYGAHAGSACACYVVQPSPAGLCDALFRALPLVGAREHALVGLPDTVWFPESGFSHLSDEAELSFLLFPVERPELFDAVSVSPQGWVEQIEVKARAPRTRWVWGGFKIRGRALGELHQLWQARERKDEYLGTLVNAWIAGGGRARAFATGEAYVDVGTFDGYRQALRLLMQRSAATSGAGAAGKESSCASR